jgi:hypothetical protein
MPGGLQGTGYSQEDLDALLADVERDATAALGSLPSAPVHHDHEPGEVDHDPGDREPRDAVSPPRGGETVPATEGDTPVMVIHLPVDPDDHAEYRRLLDAARETLGTLPAPEVVLRALRALVVLADWGPQLTDDQASALAAIGVTAARP